MLVAPAPAALPINTANPPTEAVAAEAAKRPQIPQPPSAADSPNSRNSTEFADQQQKANANQGLPSTPSNQVQERQERSSDEDQDNEQRQGRQGEQSQGPTELSAEEQKLVQELQNRDRQVRAHEQAHAAAGGALAGAPNLEYTTGPDGKRYAVSGEVSIDLSAAAGDPQATIRKMQQVQRAALAPANPSAQDARVASIAASQANEARVELASQRREEALAAINGEATQDDDKAVNGSTATSSNSQSRSTNRVAVESDGFYNPVRARRQSAQLSQRIAFSGALDEANEPQGLSLRA